MFGLGGLNLTMIVGALLAVSVVANIWQFNRHESYVEQASGAINQLEGANKRQSETIGLLQKKIVENQQQILDLGNKIQKIEATAAAEQRKLQSYKRRVLRAAKKRGILQKRANKKWQRDLSDRLREVTSNE